MGANKNKLDLTGQRSGRLTAIREHSRNKQKVVLWLCHCDCGGTSVVRSSAFNSGRIRSCGCLAREVNTSHGMSKSIEYNTWMAMKARCYNEHDPMFKHYGGRGIEVCEEWRYSFEAFFRDMGPRPSSDHSIDRIANDGNYENGNCRWATRLEQQGNRGNVIRLEFRGETKTLKEWADELGVTRGFLDQRLRSGMTVEEAFTTPKRVWPTVEFNGESMPISEWSKRLGIPYTTLRLRLKVWGLPRAFEEPYTPMRPR